MAILSRTKDPARLSWADVKPLDPIGLDQFIEFENAVYIVDPHPLPSGAAVDRPRRGEIRISEAIETIVEGAPDRRMQHTRASRVPDGEYQRRMARHARIWSRVPAGAEPARPVDAIAGTALGAAQPERVFAMPGRESLIQPASPLGVPPLVRPPAIPARGAEAIIERLRAAGSEVLLSATRESIYLTAASGAPKAGAVELFQASEPLLLAHLRGSALLCTVGDHRPPDDPVAVSMLVGGTPVCARHIDEPLTAAEGVA